MIQLVVIEDSTLMQMLIRKALAKTTDMEVVGWAKDGKSGIELVMEKHPDVVVSDFMMPQFDGMHVVEGLMSKRPLPIVLLSGLDRTDVRIFDALEAGAYEFIDKPSVEAAEEFDVFGRRLRRLIKEAANTDARKLRKQVAGENTSAHSFERLLNYEVILIGASTGGPSAIEQIITNLPQNLPVPVLIAQHMPPRFLETFSKRLHQTSPIPVQVAEDGAKIEGGNIYIMPGQYNTELVSNNGHVRFKRSPSRFQEFNDPSIDCLFESAAKTYKKKAVAAVLTGMGKDGTQGLEALKNAGSYTIAQDQDSCVVFGMPKSAVEKGTVKSVVPLRDMPGFLVNCLS